MEYCDPVTTEVLVDVCLHDVMEEYMIFLEICLSLIFPS